MIIYQNDCCDCAAPGYPCDGSHKHVAHYYCDECGEEVEADDLVDGLCWYCRHKEDDDEL